MTLEQTADHVEQALSSLLSQYRERPVLEGWLSAFVDQIQELEDAFFELLLQRFLSTATGAQLDVIGRIVGRARNALGDGDYRILLSAWIRANRSDGTGDDVLDVVELALQGANLTFTPFYPASFVVWVDEAMTADPATVALLIARARLAGVNAQLVYSGVSIPASFVFAPGDAEVTSTTQGTASGDSDSTGTGGLLAEVEGA